MDLKQLHIDKQSAIPLYEQLRAQLMEAIVRHELTEGEQLPTEEELCAGLGISRPVVQAACKALIQDGYIQRIRGKGTFVHRPDTRGRFIHRQLSFAQEMEILGLPHRTEILRAEWEDSPVLCETSIAQPGPWYHLVRMRYVAGQPFVLVENEVPGALFPGIDRFDFSTRSLYDVLEREYGAHVSSARRTLRARLPDREVAALLQLGRRAAVMVVDNTVYDQSKRVIDLSREWLDGEMHPFSFDVLNQ